MHSTRLRFILIKNFVSLKCGPEKQVLNSGPFVLITTSRLCGCPSC